MTRENGSVFGRGYASQYDKVYASKDYASECDLVEAVCRRHGLLERTTLLDIGCGTGGHAIEFASRGWQVHAVDRSAAMLEIARGKAARRSLVDNASLSFIQGDARDYDAGARFDVAVMMFAVLGYLYDNAAVLEGLTNTRRHLRGGGIFAFDCWYGPAVLAQRPGDRIQVIEGDLSRTIRTARGSLDTLRHLASVRYSVLEIAGDRVVADTEEVHTMRYFFPEELRLLLDCAGFELLSVTAFPSLDAPPTDEDWNAFVVARAAASPVR